MFQKIFVDLGDIDNYLFGLITVDEVKLQRMMDELLKVLKDISIKGDLIVLPNATPFKHSIINKSE